MTDAPQWLDPRILHERLKTEGPYPVIARLAASDNPDLRTLTSVLRLSAHALASDGDQMFEQLAGRLPRGLSPSLDAFITTLLQIAPSDRLRLCWGSLRGPGLLMQTLTGHNRAVEGALLLSDDRAVSWDKRGPMRLWDLSTGACRILVDSNGYIDLGAALMPDGRLLSWTREGRLRVWELSNGEYDSYTVLGGAEIERVTFLPDHRVLACSTVALVEDQRWVWRGAVPKFLFANLGWGSVFSVLDLQTKTIKGFTSIQHTLSSKLLILSDDRVLIWSSRSIEVLDLASGATTAIDGDTKRVRGAQLLPDKSILSWGDDGALRIWDVNTAQSRTLGVHGDVSTVTLWDDDHVVSAGEDRNLCLWNLRSGERRELSGPAHAIEAVMRLSDGRVLSAGAGEMWIWDPSTFEGYSLGVHDSRVSDAQLLPDGRLLSWGCYGAPRLWDGDLNHSRPLQGHAGLWGTSAEGLAALPNNRALSWGEDGTLRLWDLSSEKRDEPEMGGFATAAALADGRIVTGYVDSAIRICSAETDEGIELAGSDHGVGAVLELPGRRLLSKRLDRLTVWDLDTLTKTNEWFAEEYAFVGVLLLSDGKVLTSSLSGALQTWDTVTGPTTLPTPAEGGVNGWTELRGGLVALASGSIGLYDPSSGTRTEMARTPFSPLDVVELPDGRVVSWDTRGTLHLWDLTSGLNDPLAGHTKAVTAAVPLESGRILSASEDCTLRLWDQESGGSFVLTGHTEPVKGLQLLRDGRALSFGQDSTPRLWKLETAASNALSGHTGPVLGAKQLEDGRVVTWSLDHSIRVWDVEGGRPPLAFYFDAAPFGVWPGGSGRLSVCDYFGRVFFLRYD